MEIDGRSLRESINSLVTGMAGMMSKQDNLTNSMTDLEDDLTKKVDHTLKEFQRDDSRVGNSCQEIRGCG